MFARCGGQEWRPETIPFAELATALEAVALYREHVHVDTDLVEVVLTRPGKPSQLGEALRTRGWVGADLEHTEAILRHLATQATTRFAVLSPFIDAGGMDNVVSLFKVTNEHVRRLLITRCRRGDAAPAALQLHGHARCDGGRGIQLLALLHAKSNPNLPRQGGTLPTAAWHTSDRRT